jgi:biotin carboxylase
LPFRHRPRDAHPALARLPVAGTRLAFAGDALRWGDMTRGARPRTLLVISGGRAALPVIARARRMGLCVLVSDGMPDAPGFRIADAGLLAAVADADATVEAARAYAALNRIDGVLGVGAEAAWTTAAVADALGLPGLATGTAALVSDRLALKRRLTGAGVPAPWGVAVAHAGAVVAAATRAGQPCLVRPVDNGARRGTVRLLPGVDPAWAFALAAAESAGGEVMLEAFVEGRAATAVALVAGGRVALIGVADRAASHGAPLDPFVVGTAHELPTRLHPAIGERIEEMLAAVAAALGLTRGVIEAEVVVGGAGPVLVDVAVQASGGALWGHALPLVTGVDGLDAAIRIALGETTETAALRARRHQAVVERVVLPPPGIVVDVRGAAEAAAGEGIVLVEMCVAPGDRIPVLPGPGRRAAIVLAVGPTHEAAAARANAAVARLRVTTRSATAAVAATLH